jgi:indolepyruvate ferredoxin oxidoreductase
MDDFRARRREPVQSPRSALDRNFAVVVTGVGGTGVVTIGAILGMAAHLEGKGCGMIDMAGLAQKGGAVFSHVRIAPTPEEIHAIRVAAGQADLVLGCDLTVTGSRRRFWARCARVTRPSSSTRPRCDAGRFHPQRRFLAADRASEARDRLHGRRDDATHLVDATAAATTFLGNAIAANMFMLGYAWQFGAAAALARFAAAGDRAERRSGGDEQAGFR